jgi:imidazolonepropionase-like amidohydrolase
MQADLRAGFTTARDMSTHGNGYGDVDIRNAINEGRLEGPRYQVSGRGIVWGGAALASATPPNPLTSVVVHSVEEGREAVREHIQHGTDWIKLFPAGGYSFTPNGEDQYEVTYPMPVLAAMIDETHRLGHKAGCHVYGGEAQKNSIIAGCATIEHGFGPASTRAAPCSPRRLPWRPPPRASSSWRAAASTAPPSCMAPRGSNSRPWCGAAPSARPGPSNPER